MKKAFIFYTILAALLFTGQTFAQFQMRLGPATGMNFNIHTGSDLPESGTGFGFVIGGQLDMDFTNTIGLVTTMQFYDNRSGSNEEESSEQAQDDNGNLFTYKISDESSVSLAYFMIEPLFKLKVPNSGLYFLMGPTFGFNVEGSQENKRTITLPEGYQFNNGSNKQTSKTSGSLDDLLARFELKFGAGYNIPISSNLYLFPQLTFGYGITKVQSDVAWRVLTIQTLVGVKFRLI